jgi:hypothetical protein
MCGSNPVGDIARVGGDVMTFGTNELVGNPIGKLGGAAGNAVGGVLGGGSGAPGAPQLPQYPGMSPQEVAILQQQGSGLNQLGGVVGSVSGQLGNNQNILQMISGLFNSDGTINQTALGSLQKQAQQNVQGQQQVGQGALGYLNNYFGSQNPLPQAPHVQTDTGALGTLQAAEGSYQNALAGKIPVNQQLQFQQTQNFNAMKEQAAQQGIEIQGDDWQSATSKSTAGQKLIQNYQQNSNIQNQQYQLGYMGQLGSQIPGLSSAFSGQQQIPLQQQDQALQGYGLGLQGQGQGLNAAMGTAGYGTNALQQPLGYLGQSITGGQGALAPMLQQYNQMASSMYQPYYMQQQGPYQQQMAQAQAGYQAQQNQYQGQQNMLGGIMNLGGKLGAAYLGAPGA